MLSISSRLVPREPLHAILLALIAVLALAALFHIRNPSSSGWTVSLHPAAAGTADIGRGSHRYAFATLLPPNSTPDRFTSVRYLNFILRHNPGTKSRAEIPLVVLAPGPHNQDQLQSLASENVAVTRLAPVQVPEWLENKDSAVVNALAKLHLWKLTTYDRICFLDAATLITSPLDGVFDDPAVNIHETQVEYRPGGDKSLLSLPASYVLAAQYDTYSREHALPPLNNESYFDAGFMVLKPSMKMSETYDRLLNKPDKWERKGMYAEQDLLNAAHNRTGAMPWQVLGQNWSVGNPTRNDLDAGVVSLRDEMWREGADGALVAIWKEQVKRMDEFYRAIGPV